MARKDVRYRKSFEWSYDSFHHLESAEEGSGENSGAECAASTIGCYTIS